MDGIRPGYVLFYFFQRHTHKNRRGDPRTRSRRVQRQIDSWKEQMPLLVDAYLEFRANGGLKANGTLDPSIDGSWPLTVIGFDGAGVLISLSFVLTSHLESCQRFFSHTTDVIKANETLLRCGYIGASPDTPAIAFSLRTFEIFRQIHRVTPRFTLDSLAKTLNHLHKVRPLSHLRFCSLMSVGSP